MDRPKFVIEASEAESMASRAGVNVVELLPSLVKLAQTLARPPISKYHVGAVGLGSSGRIFFGVNLEFPNLPLHHSVHAEQFLLTNLSINSESRLEFMVVSSTPCGHCRQFLQEVRNAPDIKIQIPSESNEFNRLSDFLPHRFGPDDLLQRDVPLLLEPHGNGLSFSDETRLQNLCNGARIDIVNGFSKWDALKSAALEAANKSHAPYSGCPSGVAVMDCEGNIFRGSYAESAAYNPSLGPVQAALVHFVVGGGGGGYERLVCSVLVEKENCDVKQEHTARLLMSMVSPECEFRVFRCTSKA